VKEIGCCGPKDLCRVNVSLMRESDRFRARLEDLDPTHCSRRHFKVERLVQSVNGRSPIRSRSRHRRNQRDLVARNAARLIEGALNRRWVGGIPSQNTGAHPRSV